MTLPYPGANSGRIVWKMREKQTVSPASFGSVDAQAA